VARQSRSQRLHELLRIARVEHVFWRKEFQGAAGILGTQNWNSGEDRLVRDQTPDVLNRGKDEYIPASIHRGHSFRREFGAKMDVSQVQVARLLLEYVLVQAASNEKQRKLEAFPLKARNRVEQQINAFASDQLAYMKQDGSRPNFKFPLLVSYKPLLVNRVLEFKNALFVYAER
jgi:hypothetical protein